MVVSYLYTQPKTARVTRKNKISAPLADSWQFYGRDGRRAS